MLHVGPHMGPHDFLKKSPLSDANGWVDVDRHTMQSTKYDNVFALGDCTNTPNSKTAAAVTSQAPVVVHNMGRVMEKQPLDGYYTGYASCPLVVGRNRVMLAEFMYGGALAETFSRETGKFPWKYIGTEGYVQERFFFFLKETVFPYVYWNLWTKVRKSKKTECDKFVGIVGITCIHFPLLTFLLHLPGILVRHQWACET